MMSEMVNRRIVRLKCLYVHRLVAQCFVEGDTSLHVAHLDGSRDNNHYLNLAWVTAKENASHKKIHGTLLEGDAHPSTKICDRAVVAIRRMSDAGFSRQEIGYFFELSQNRIWRLLNDSRKGT
jgi:hypothetical protein